MCFFLFLCPSFCPLAKPFKKGNIDSVLNFILLVQLSKQCSSQPDAPRYNDRITLQKGNLLSSAAQFHTQPARDLICLETS